MPEVIGVFRGQHFAHGHGNVNPADRCDFFLCVPTRDRRNFTAPLFAADSGLYITKLEVSNKFIM
jgi:hypothetical protein